MPDETDFLDEILAKATPKAPEPPEPPETVHIIFGHEVCKNCGGDYHIVHSVYSRVGDHLWLLIDLVDKQRPPGTIYETTMEEVTIEFCYACHKDYLERVLHYTK